MPQVVADNGATVTVQFPDGSTQEILKEAYPVAFPGGDYEPDDPTGAQGRAQLQAAGAAVPVEPAAPEAPPPAAPNPTGAFGLAGPGAGTAAKVTADTELAPPAPEPRPGPPPLHDPRRAQEIQQLPEYAEGTRDYGAARIGVQSDIADVESQQLTQLAGSLGEHDKRAAEIEANKLKAHKAGLAAADARAKEIDTLADEHKNATTDRGRLWKNMSTGNKILAAIGLGLSAIGQAKSRQGGQNPALAILLKAIEDDVADQRADITKTGEVIAEKRGLLKEFQGRLGEGQASYDMALAMSAARVQRKIEIVGAQSGSEKVKLQAQDMAAQLGQYVADKEEMVRQQAGEDAYRVHQMRLSEIKAAGKGGGAGASMKPNAGRVYKVWDATSGKLIDRQLTEKERDQSVLIPGTGEAFVAPNVEAAKDLNNRLTAARNISEALSTIERLRDQNGWETDTRWYASADAQKALSAYQRALINYKEAYGLGAISESDLKLVEGAIGGSPTGWKNFSTTVAATRNGVESDVRNRLVQYGWTPQAGDISLPAFATQSKAGRASLADRNLKLKAAVESGDRGKIQEAARDLIGRVREGGFADSYATGEAQRGGPEKVAPEGSPRELSKAEKVALGKKKPGTAPAPAAGGDRYTAGSSRDEAQRAIDLLGKIQKKDRLITTIDGEVDPVEYLSKFLREGSRKDAKARERDNEPEAFGGSGQIKWLKSDDPLKKGRKF
jgi:tetratricopeptide (TPR) repeat protein